MITHASFKNFKSLRNTEIDFQRLTVIVGPNASGKTSILEGLNYLLGADSEDSIPVGPSGLSLHTRGSTGDLVLQCANEGRMIRISRPMLPTKDASSPRKKSIRLRMQIANRSDAGTPGGPRWEVAPDQLVIADVFGSAALFRLDPARLAAPKLPDRSVPQLDYDGGGLASVLANLLLAQRNVFDKLEGYLRAVIPAVEKVRFERKPVRHTGNNALVVDESRPPGAVRMGDYAEVLVLDFDGALDIPAKMVSQGTLLVLGILAIILGPGTPRLLLLDDIEHGLHPKVQRDLLQLLHKLLEEQPDLQIIATSHSPYLLDSLDPKEVRITYAADGISYCAPLTAHPEFERWKGEMLPGEFWSAVGEQWAKDAAMPGAK